MITFNEILIDIAELSNRIKESNFKPDYLIGLARGGWIPTRLFSNELKVKEILSIGMKYQDSSRTALVTYSKPDPMPTQKSILLIEDCLESGNSMVAAKKLLLGHDNDVRTVAIYITDQTKQIPDFFQKHYSIAPKFPWEK